MVLRCPAHSFLSLRSELEGELLRTLSSREDGIADIFPVVSLAIEFFHFERACRGPDRQHR